MRGTASVLVWSLWRQAQEESVREGVEAFVGLYYSNYEDAVAVDAKTYRMLDELLAAADIPESLDDIIRKAERSFQDGFMSSQREFINLAATPDDEDEMPPYATVG